MKSWLAKFRISAALDAGKPWPESLRQKVTADPELERFARRVEVLGRALRNVPLVEASQHNSIMRAVRVTARQDQPRRVLTPLWLAASVVVAALTLVCLWTAFHRPAKPARQPLDGAVMVLEMSERMPGTMPQMMIAPLSDEWARVDHDLHDTTQVLLASFP